MKYVFAFAFALLIVFTGNASILPVTSLADAGAGSLRQQVQTATAGDTLRITQNGVIMLNSVIFLDKNLVIQGIDTATQRISTQGSRAFSIAAQTQVVLEKLYFKGCQLTPMSADTLGGAILNRGNLLLRQCRFTHNTAIHGGAVGSTFHRTDSSKLRIIGCTFAYNQAFGDAARLIGGGAVCGVGFYPQDSVHIFLQDCIFHQNTSLTSAGGLAAFAQDGASGYIETHGCVFSENTAFFGGAWVSDCYNNGNFRLFIHNTSFVQNTSIDSLARGGGAVNMGGNGGGKVKAFYTNCTFSGNKSGFRGGGLESNGQQQSPVASIDSTFLNNCTFAYNTARYGGGIEIDFGTVLFPQNSLLAYNDADDLTQQFRGNMQTLGNNLVMQSPAVVNTKFVPAATDIVLKEPYLSDLTVAPNGQYYHLPRCNSPALNAASASAAATDIRGAARYGLPDIGASERNPALDIQVNTFAHDGFGSLRQAIAASCPYDTIDMRLLTGEIHLREEIAIPHALSIWGNPTQPLLLHGDDSVRIFTVLADTMQPIVFMKHLTFAHARPALYGGGAIRNNGGKIWVENCTFRDCSAQSGGAVASFGTFAQDSANSHFLNCTFARNTATALDGGAIDNRTIVQAATTTVVFCTFSENKAEEKGGAIANDVQNGLQVANCIIANNFAFNGGNDVYSSAGHLSKGITHNLLSDSAGSRFPAANLLLSASPQLNSLGWYDGPTETYQLLANSPAIDAGVVLFSGNTYDQRGQARIFGVAPDLGAYEYDPATRIETAANTIPPSVLFPTQGAAQTVWVRTFSDLPLRISVVTLQGKILWQRSYTPAEINLHAQDAVALCERGCISEVRFVADIPVDISFLSSNLYLIRLEQQEKPAVLKLTIE